MRKLLALLSALIMALGLSTCAHMKPAAPPDYLGRMAEAALAGDTEAGRQIAAERDAWLDSLGSAEARIDFDELFLLSRLIEAEAGEDRFSDELRLCVGEVALNRVASPEFPDTLEDVIYQPGQYLSVSQPEFRDGLLPRKASVRAALRLLQGERMLAPQVLYQSHVRLGPIFARFYDSIDMRTTYFCESVNRKLYPADT